MVSRYTIRPAKAEDQPALLGLVWKTVMVSDRDRETLLAHPEAVQVPVEQLTPATACIADADGTPAGFAVVLRRSDGGAELDGLFVDPQLQRLGIGRRLIEESKQLARAMGATELHVVANDDALAFYQAVGFTQTGITETEFGTAPVMRLNLRGR